MKLSHTLSALGLGLAPLLTSGCVANHNHDEASTERPMPPSVVIEGEPMYTVLPKDAIPSINAPEFLSGEAAAAQMAPSEMVMGIVGKNGTAKAYSAWQLDGHEIVNDSLDGEPIAATW